MDNANLSGGLTVNLSEESINQVVNEVTKRVYLRLSELLKQAASPESVRDSVKEILLGMSPVKNEEEHKPVVETAAPVVAAQKPKAVKAPFDVKRVVKTIMDAMNLVSQGENPDEASEILRQEVHSLTNNRIDVIIRKSPKGRVSANFSETAELRQRHHHKWNGKLRPEDFEKELKAVSDSEYVPVEETEQKTKPAASASTDADDPNRDSSTPLRMHIKKTRPQHPYSQGTYRRIKRGSHLMRMRCSKGSDELAPMVVDPEFAEEMMEKKMTHVHISRGSDKDGLYMVFVPENIRTRAPKKSSTISRLHPYGKNNANGKVTTYAINSTRFQETILKHFNLECKGLQEQAFSFEIVKNADDKCAIKIFKATI